MQESGITAKGQTTLPKSVRAALGVEPGDRVRYLILDGGDVRLLRTKPVTALAGVLHNDGPPVTLDDMDAAIDAGRARADGAP